MQHPQAGWPEPMLHTRKAVLVTGAAQRMLQRQRATGT